MKCLNCGAEIDANSKFCGYCGSPVEEQIPQTNDEVQIDEQNVNVDQPEVVNPFGGNVEPPQPTEDQISNLSNTQPEQPQVQSEPVQNEQNVNTPKDKKKSNSLIFIIGGVILAVIAAVLLIVAFNKKSGSISALEKAINNTISSGSNSGTITASILVEANGMSVDLSAAAKYQKVNDAYNLQLTLNKSMFSDEIDVYASLDKENAMIYAKTSLIDMMNGKTSLEDSWGYYKVDLSEITSELKENVKTDNKIKLTELGIDKKIKYVGKSNGASHYVLTIDKELFNILESKMTSEEIKDTNEMLDSMQQVDDMLDKGYEIDFYVKNDKLEKISMDLSKFMEGSGASKAVFSIEFKDFNNTVVTIPSEAKKGIDLKNYAESSVNVPVNNIEYDTSNFNSVDSFDLSNTDSFDFNIQ